MEAKTLPDLPPAQASDETSSFYIQATESIQERWPRTLKQGDTFALFDMLGDVVEPGMTPGGTVPQRHPLSLRRPAADRRPAAAAAVLGGGE